jgi:PAS domain S-box-containing protein
MIEEGPFDQRHKEEQSSANHTAARAFWTAAPQVTQHPPHRPDGLCRWNEIRTERAGAASTPIGAAISKQDPSPASGPAIPSVGNLDPIQAAKIVEDLFGNAWAFDAAGRWTYLPAFAQAALGKTVDDLNLSVAEGDIGWKQLLHPDDYAAVAEKWQHCLRTGQMFNAEFRIRRQSGFAWAKSSARPVFDERGQIAGWYGTSLDIDGYRGTVVALQERENSLSHLVDLVPCHLWRLNAEGEPTFMNKRMADYLGWDFADAGAPDESGNDAIFDTIHPDDVDDVRAALGECLATGENFSSHYRTRRRDGVFRWKSVCAEPVKDPDGGIAHWYGMCLDIDDQIRAEEAQQLSERHLQRLIDLLPVSICSWAVTGEISYANKRFVGALGISDMTFDNAFAAILARTHPEDAERLRETVERGLRAGDGFSARYRWRSADGGVFRWLETRFEARRDLDGVIVEWFSLRIDVDDAVRVQDALSSAQANLARASQAATLAELSASIAHEVAQPLAALLTNSDTCRRWLAMDPPNIERARTAIERIQRAASRASDVVTRIRALYRHAADERAITALGALIDETYGLLAADAARRHIRMDVNIGGNLPDFAFDRVQIQQVLINLMRNGMQAMETVSGDRILGVRAFLDDGMVKVEISDTGPGVLSPEMIFEPFFTTKSEGLGMGLAICRSIVESHHGRLWVEQDGSNGAKFIFALPVDIGDS